MNCEDCPSRIVWTPKYGNMRKIKKFLLCIHNDKQKLKPNSKPKWCPYRNE